MIGLKFGMWTVISESATRTRGARAYLCRCICGVEHVCDGRELRRGKSKGCLKDNKIAVTVKWNGKKYVIKDDQ